MSELFNKNEVRKALSTMLEPGAVFEVRALDAKLSGSYRTGIISGYFDNADACLSELEKLAAAKGIYITLNPVNRALLARRANRLDYADKDSTTKDHHVLRRWQLLVDVDPVRPSGISATDAEKEAAHRKTQDIYAFLQKHGWPKPIAADSGNGYQLIYRIELPCDDGGLTQKVLAALAKRFDGDGVEIDPAVHNESRIFKLCGTRACKGDNMPERPWRLSKILDVPEQLQVVTAEQLQALVDELLPKEPEKGKATASRSAERNTKPSKAEIREMLAVLPKRPHYHDWFPICAAVGDALPLEDAIELLNEWSPEEEPGEYAKKLQSGLEKIHVGTLFHIAKQHGWKPPPRAQSEKEPLELPPPPPPYVPPPLALLPSKLQDYVSAAAESLNVDVSFILLPLLSALGSAIGNTRSIFLKRGFVQPPVIWTTIVGRSGSRKSPALEKATFAVMEHERELARQSKQAIEKYENDKAEWESNSKKPPAWKSCMVDDLTLAVLAEALELNPRGLLVRRDELSGWYSSFDQFTNAKGSDVSRWLSLHTGDSFAFDRRSDKRHYRLWQPRVCITGGIQPRVLRRVLTEDFFERGLPARFLPAYPPMRQDKWSEAEVSDELRTGVLELFGKLWLLQPESDDHGQPRPKLLPLDSDAHDEYVRYYDECGDSAVQADEHEEAAWCKLTGYAARLALVGELARDPNAEHVTGETTRAACTLARWFGNEAVRIYAELAETPEQRLLRRLFEFIQSRGGSVTIREVTQSFRPLKNNRDEAERQLNKLVAARLGNWEEVGTTEKGGRPTRKFQISHLSTSTKPHHLRRETGGIVDVDNPNSEKSEAPHGTDTEAETLVGDESGVARL
jgi:uncharacterized protein DUF3987